MVNGIPDEIEESPEPLRMIAQLPVMNTDSHRQTETVTIGEHPSQIVIIIGPNAAD